MPKKGEYVKCKNYESKIKSPLIIYADFESNLVLEDNRKQNPKCKISKLIRIFVYIACSYGYKLVCLEDKFSKPFKTYFGEGAVYNFINSMIEDSKCCSEMIKKVNKELVMTKEDNEDFKNSTKRWICDNDYVDNNAQVRDHCHITRKY